MSQNFPKILVVGDIMLDHYIHGVANRISPEAPVLVVENSDEVWQLGGAANVANNLSAIGVKVTLAGCVGNDDSGLLARELLFSKGIEGIICSKSKKPTTTKTRVLVGNHQLLRIDKEDRLNISKQEESFLLKEIEDRISNFSLVVLSDYSKGTLTSTLIHGIIALSAEHGIRAIVDPKDPPFSKYFGAFLLKPNRIEAYRETGLRISDQDTFHKAARTIMNETACKAVIITLSENGVGLKYEEVCTMLPTEATKVIDVTGAGDTFTAILAYALAIGKSVAASCELANYASGIVVGRAGCVAISFEDIKSKI